MTNVRFPKVPPEKRRTPLTISMSHELYLEIVERAKIDQMSVSAWISLACEAVIADEDLKLK